MCRPWMYKYQKNVMLIYQTIEFWWKLNSFSAHVICLRCLGSEVVIHLCREQRQWRCSPAANCCDEDSGDDKLIAFVTAVFALFLLWVFSCDGRDNLEDGCIWMSFHPMMSGLSCGDGERGSNIWMEGEMLLIDFTKANCVGFPLLCLHQEPFCAHLSEWISQKDSAWTGLHLPAGSGALWVTRRTTLCSVTVASHWLEKIDGLLDWCWRLRDWWKTHPLLVKKNLKTFEKKNPLS